MGLTEDFYSIRAKKKKKEEEEREEAYAKSTFLSDQYHSLRIGKNDDIAPVAVTTSGNVAEATTTKKSADADKKDLFGLDFFQSGAFSNGYQFGDVTKTILGTAGDIGTGVSEGVFRTVEGLTDLGMYGVAGVADLLGADEHAKKVRKDAEFDTTGSIVNDVKEGLDKYSVLGDTTTGVANALGQIGMVALTGGLGAAAGLGTLGTTALTSGLLGLSSTGSGMSEAYQSGATDEEAALYGLIAGASDAFSEMLFGGMGKGIKGIGFSKGLSSADDVIAKNVSGMFKNQIAKNFAEFGVKASAEGVEEVLAGIGQAWGKSITYRSEEELSEIIKDENLLEQFIVGAVTSGIAQSGIVPGMSEGSLKEANKTGRDFITGLNANEQSVIDKEFADRVAEAEKDGKVSAKDKSKIYDAVMSDMDKGYITTDTIEEVLGGESYKSYRSAVDQDEALRKEYDTLMQEYNTLNKIKFGEMTGEQQDRRAELKRQLEELKAQIESEDASANRNQLKQKLGDEVFSLVKGGRLTESYNERARRGQAFEADLSQYNEAQKAIVQKAVDSGFLNNTNRTHEFVDMVAKISADKGVLFDFTNNERLKESGFALNGKTVNGYVTKDGITINMDSGKYVNSVVGHEITHVLEGTELYTELQQAVKAYAESKGEYKNRYDTLSELYKDIEGADIDAELTADLVGDYLFTDSDFISRLSTEHRNVFQKIYDEIKYLYKVATAGSKEARELEKVKKAFDKAYRDDGKGVSGIKYALEMDMTEAERFNELKDRTLYVVESADQAEYQSQLDSIDSLPPKAKSKVEKKIYTLAEDLGILRKPMSTPEIKFEFQISKHNGLKKSIHNQLDYGGSYGDFARALVNLDKIIPNAVLIDAYTKDRYTDTTRADERFEGGYVLLGAFQDSENIIPVKLTIKKEAGETGNLYVVVAMTKIKRTSVTGSEGTTPDGVEQPLPDTGSTYSLQQIISNVNTVDADFLKYLPDGFLSAEQMEAKSVAIEKQKQKKAKYSLADNTGKQLSKQPRKYGNYNVRGQDLQLETETEQEGLAPIADVAGTDALPDDFAPIAETTPKEVDEAIQPKRQKESVESSATPAEQARAKILTEESKSEKKKGGLWSKIKNNVLDKGMVFEDLSLATGNRELQARWNSIRYAESKAQKLIGEGNASVNSLDSIRAEVESTGKEKQFYEYLYHLHNADRMTLSSRYADVEDKPVFGYSVTAEESQATAAQLEMANPEFKEYAQEVYAFNAYLREMLVEGGVISRETADLWAEMYPHYVPIRRLGDEGLNINVPLDTGRTGVNAPIKRAKGGSRDILPLFKTMAMRTIQTYKAIAKNRFGVELKNTLGTTIESDLMSIDDTIDSIDAQDSLLQEGKNGQKPTFTVFENGEKVTFEITDEMYDAMKPTSEGTATTIKPFNAISNFRRGTLTEYNPWFLLKNAVKDIQDVLLNSQHAASTYASIPKAIAQMTTKGQWYQEYVENGGDQNTYFYNDTGTFKKENSTLETVKTIFGLNAISKANNVVEMLPRLAEYIASREAGRSIDVSMLDAARVTTNFAAGGDLTKFANRNGVTFLNASVQGAMQQVRNIREAKMNGLRGWAGLAGKFIIAGLPALLLNGLVWDDDEEYEELSDYVKQNYYIVGKYSDGKFVRIPKGRAVAVIQNAFEQIQNARTGDDEVDLKAFIDLAVSNLAPNDPLDNNIFSPIRQVAKNKTWYGEDLVPTRLKDLPAAEQYDESTDSISRWLGETFGVSPVKANYLLDQYSGVIGDTFLPMLTPEAESGDNSFAGNMIAPLKDMFTTDSVMKNQNVSDFYDTKEKLTVNAKASTATDEDILKSKYMNSVNSDLSELYALKREVQNSNLPNDRKYEKVRAIQEEIVTLARESLNTYQNVQIEDGYAVVGDRYYRLKDGEWTKITDEQLDKQEDVIDELGISGSDYWSNKSEYDFAYEYPERYTVAKSVGGYEAFKTYSKELYDIKADKDENGKSITGSRKEKVIDYVNNLDADYGVRIILFKSEYNADDTYNHDIIEYLNGREDISYEEMETILKELGFTVSSDGTISW